MSIPKDKTTITAIVDKEDKKALQELADNDRRSLSNYVALVLEEHLKSKGKKK